MRFKNQLLRYMPIVCTLAMAGCSSDSNTTPEVPNADTLAAMTFFVTSVGIGDGGNLGGLPGADVHCATLAADAGAQATEWRAYLSTTGADGINAIERIGAGPWVNANGVIVATDTANLLSEESNINLETAITESGAQVNGLGDTPLMHDILTGTELNGLASTAAGDTTCGNWTSNNIGFATVGHHDRAGGGANPTSFSSAHPTSGCTQADFQAFGGDGLFYCFVMN